MSRRSRRRRAREREREVAEEHLQKNNKGFSLSSLITNVDFRTLSSQLKDIAGYMETFSQITELFKLADVFINPKEGESKGQSFNLMNILKDKESLNQLFETLTPDMPERSMDLLQEKKVEPIKVETHQTENESRTD